MAIFDLEIQKVSELTTSGVKKLSDIFYGETDLIENAKWDEALPVDYFFYRKSPQLWARYNSMKNVLCTSYISHVEDNFGFEMYKLLIKRGSSIPFWNAGIASFYRMRVRISNNNFRELATYDPLFDRYVQPVGIFASSTDIDVTLNKIYAGVADISKEFMFVTQIATVSVVTEIPTVAPQYSIFVKLENNVYSIYSSRYNAKVVYLGDANLSGEWKTYNKSTMNNGDVYFDTVNNKIFIKENGFIYDLQHKISFEAEKRYDYMFLVEKDPYTESNLDTVYMSKFDRKYIDVQLGTLAIDGTQYFTFPEYPFIDMVPTFRNSITDEIVIGVEYFPYRNVMKVVNNSGVEIKIFATWNTVPIVSFNRNIWSSQKDVKHFMADFSPNIVSFTNGTICLFGKESDMSMRPAILDIEVNKTLLEALGNVRVTATLKNQDEVPLSGRRVSLNIVDDIYHMAKWTGDDDVNFEAKTNMAGEIHGTLINSQMKFGWCLQKEWAGEILMSEDKRFIYYDEMGIPLRVEGTKKRLYFPFELGVSDPNRVFLYLVTADDPILGMVAAYWNSQSSKYVVDESFTGAKAKEYYGRSGQLNSYELVARKIGHVAIMSGVTSSNEISIETRFKKPTRIVQLTDQEMLVRNSVIYSSELENGSKLAAESLLTKYLNSTESNDFEIVEETPTIYTNARYGWDNNWLLSDEEDVVTYIRVKPKSCSYFEFDYDVPGIDDPNVIGYYIVVDLGGKVSVQASHLDETTNTLIESEKLTIDLESYIKSESAFTLAENKPDGFNVNNFLGSFGYLSISDYLKSPFGINACSMICTYSNGTSKCTKRSLKDDDGNVLISYRDQYYKTDDSVFNMWCLHNNEYDAQLPEDQRCPGLQARFVNPFLLYVTKN